MRVACIADSHFGIKNDSEPMRKYQQEFFDSTFFPYVDKHKITKVIHLGDLMDRRKYGNYLTASWVSKFYIEPCVQRKLDTDIILGNHDIFFKNTNEVNSPNLILYGAPGFTVHQVAQDVTLEDGTILCYIPWIPDDEEWKNRTLKSIDQSRADYAFGHLELNGYQFTAGVPCEHGYDKTLVTKFSRVFSGHFHMKQGDGHIEYLGTPYQLSMDDVGVAKGFHIFDTKTGQIEFIENTEKLFYKIHYRVDQNYPTDPESLAKIFAGKYVRIFAPANKTDPVHYDKFLDGIAKCAADVKVTEESNAQTAVGLNSSNEAHEKFGQDTLSFMLGEVDFVMERNPSEVLKKKSRDLIQRLYTEAMHTA